MNYTAGNQFKLNGLNYIGYYNVNKNKYFTGRQFKFNISKQLVKIVQEKQIQFYKQYYDNYEYYNQLLFINQNYIIDINKINKQFIYRFFIKQILTNNIYQVNKQVYDKISERYFIKVKFNWKITVKRFINNLSNLTQEYTNEQLNEILYYNNNQIDLLNEEDIKSVLNPLQYVKIKSKYDTLQDYQTNTQHQIQFIKKINKIKELNFTPCYNKYDNSYDLLYNNNITNDTITNYNRQILLSVGVKKLNILQIQILNNQNTVTIQRNIIDQLKQFFNKQIKLVKYNYQNKILYHLYFYSNNKLNSKSIYINDYHKLNLYAYTFYINLNNTRLSSQYINPSVITINKITNDYDSSSINIINEGLLLQTNDLKRIIFNVTNVIKLVIIQKEQLQIIYDQITIGTEENENTIINIPKLVDINSKNTIYSNLIQEGYINLDVCEDYENRINYIKTLAQQSY